MRSTDYVLLNDDEHTENSSTFNMLEQLIGSSIPRTVEFPEISISQHTNAMQFHYGNYTAVKTKIKHALREKNAAITELARLSAVSEGKGENVIKAFTQLVDDVLPTRNTAVLNISKPQRSTAYDNHQDKQKRIIQIKNEELATLKLELKEHADEIKKCELEIAKIKQDVADVKKLAAESAIQEPERKEVEPIEQSGHPYLQMPH